MSFVVVVDFDVAAGAEAEFLALVKDNADASVRLEPGCSRFDVAVSAGGRKVFLYEIYDDEAAFRAHLATPHFVAFDRATAALVEAKAVRTFALEASPAKAAA